MEFIIGWLQKLFGLTPAGQGAKLTSQGSLAIAGITIPEPTRSLLFLTNDTLDKIESPLSITLTLTPDGIKQDEPNDWYQEPSLIWTRLPIVKNRWLEEKPMYYPSYSRLSPEHRYQYLSWLKDVTQPTNLSYVFLYYYGLERHLLIGNYDGAVAEIVRLAQHHDRGTFKHYAAAALLASSAYRQRPDILERAPFVMETVNNPGLIIRMQLGLNLKAEELIQIASRVGFTNKRYVKSHPEKFTQALQAAIDDDQSTNGKIFERVDFSAMKKDKEIYFANLSVPEKVRYLDTLDVLDDRAFKAICKGLLEAAHQKIKAQLAQERSADNL